ncbi:MAG: ATP-binding cassette domain-containing protein [Eubacteriales bacterium]|nr:ATP-binding cassette domain-containing protein [Eubacteriales bacterium]
MLALEHVNLTYNPGTVREMGLFRDFSLDVPQGQYLSVVGSNGSGKTTMLNLLCGSLMPDEGKVRMMGQDITARSEHLRAREIGRIHQNPAMGSCAKMSILENLALSDSKQKKMNLLPAVDKKQVTRYQEMLSPLGLGLENMLEARAGTLSGGQRQALALIMAVMTPISCLILDEHTAALDPKTADTIMRLTDSLIHEKGLTAIMVTHNLRYALDYGNRIVMMHQGQVVLDESGEDKQALRLEKVLGLFNEISVECGN